MPSVLPAQWVSFQLTLSSVTWTGITISIASCQRLMLRNDSSFDIKLRTDQADPSTEEALHPGTELLIPLTPSNLVSFRNGVTVAYAQTFSGTGPLFVRQVQ